MALALAEVDKTPSIPMSGFKDDDLSEVSENVNENFGEMIWCIGGGVGWRGVAGEE